MFEFIRSFANNTWDIVAEMAPYLIFGFLMSALLFRLIQPKSVERILGKPGLGAVLKACLVGIPMPLCSCSVVPVAASLHKGGASRGATAAFISSTPQTGVDSIFATYSLMGGLFTAVRVIVAFVSGIITGFLIELFCSRQSQGEEDSNKKVQESCCNATASQRPKFTESLRYGFVKLPSELAFALALGLVLAGLITTLLPADLFEGSFSSGPAAFLIATLVGLPLYVCATASIPMAYGLIAAGLSPGAALVFLIVGPATNTATIVTIWKIIGQKATVIYLVSMLVVSWLAGWIFNASVDPQSIVTDMHRHEASTISLLQHIFGIALIVILAHGLFREKVQNAEKKCCSENCG